MGSKCECGADLSACVPMVFCEECGRDNALPKPAQPDAVAAERDEAVSRLRATTAANDRLFDASVRQTRIAESERDTAQSRLDAAVALIKDAWQFIGHAECHGTKCRLPHCLSCYGDDAGQKGADMERRIDAFLRAHEQQKGGV